jgi:UDP-glucose 4-epimerase
MTDLAGQRVLVTGASGFIGGHLVHRLMLEGAEVHAVQRRAVSPDTRSGPQVHVLDLTDGEALRAALRLIRPDIVFHAAASRSEDDWQDLSAVNISVPMLLLEACVAGGARRLVTLGSSQELSTTPPTAYAASRSAGALFMQYHAERWSMPLTHIRTGFVYGPGISARKLIPMAIRAGIEGKVLPITPDSIKRNYIHVDDLVDACLAAAQRCGTDVQSVDAVSEDMLSAREVTKAIGAILGKPVAVEVTTQMIRDWDRSKISYDPSAAQKLLGWQPRVTLQAGLKDMIDRARCTNAA